MQRRKGRASSGSRDHTHRLFDSAKIYRIEIPYDAQQIIEACKEVVSANGLTKGAYLRPIAFRGYGEIGVAPKIDPPIDVAVAAWEWGTYLGADGLQNGVDVCVSSWQRVAPNTIPALGKAGGNYLSSQLISMEAKRLGFAEGIGLTPDGMVSEGAGENLFLVKDGVIYTPVPRLLGARRHHARLGRTPRTRAQLRSARDIDPARDAVSRRRAVLHRHGRGDHADPLGRSHPVGIGRRGPITRDAAERLLRPVQGRTPDKWGWLDPVDGQGVKAAAAG